jgi:hypothetical protein
MRVEGFFPHFLLSLFPLSSFASIRVPFAVPKKIEPNSAKSEKSVMLFFPFGANREFIRSIGIHSRFPFQMKTP